MKKTKSLAIEEENYERIKKLGSGNFSKGFDIVFRLYDLYDSMMADIERLDIDSNDSDIPELLNTISRYDHLITYEYKR